MRSTVSLKLGLSSKLRHSFYLLMMKPQTLGWPPRWQSSLASLHQTRHVVLALGCAPRVIRMMVP